MFKVAANSAERDRQDAPKLAEKVCPKELQDTAWAYGTDVRE